MAGPGLDPVDKSGGHRNLGYLSGGGVAGHCGTTPYAASVLPKGQ